MNRDGQNCTRNRKIGATRFRHFLRKEVLLGVAMGLFLYFAVGASSLGSALAGALFCFALLAAKRRQEIVEEAERKIRARERMMAMDALLDIMMGEPAVQRAKDAYASVKKAADDPWDDTGWDEPWAAAIQAAFLYAIEQ